MELPMGGLANVHLDSSCRASLPAASQARHTGVRPDDCVAATTCPGAEVDLPFPFESPLLLPLPQLLSLLMDAAAKFSVVLPPLIPFPFPFPFPGSGESHVGRGYISREIAVGACETGR